MLLFPLWGVGGVCIAKGDATIPFTMETQNALCMANLRIELYFAPDDVTCIMSTIYARIRPCKIMFPSQKEW